MKMKKQLDHAAGTLIALMILSSTLNFPLSAQETAGKHVIHANKETRYYQGSVRDLAWLEGSWVGEGLGGRCHEIWEKPSGNTMMGMFKLIKDEKPVFYEFFLLIETEEGIELRLKHFDPYLNAWEAKNEFITFKLIDVEGQKAIFSGLTFEKIAENELQIFLDIRYDDGNVIEEYFKFEKQI